MYRKHFHKTHRQVFSIKKWKMRTLFWSFAILVGVVAALFALGSNVADHFFRYLYQNHIVLAYLLPPVGLALIAWLTQNVFKGTEGSGIPQAIAALSMKNNIARNSVLSLKLAAGKILLTCLGLFSGASIGREGPTVHVGASIMYSLRHFRYFRGQKMVKSLILAGGAAGISAAFNTPLAGIIFAIEEMSRSFEEKTSSTLLIVVVLAGLTALLILDEYTYFGSTSATLPFSSAWIAVILLGVVGGILGGIFSTILIYGTKKIAPAIKQHPMIVAFTCGVLISIIGYLSNGQTFGTGYLEAKNLVTGGEADPAFPFYKFLATVVSYLSGIPGGIFAPSLSIGAGFGSVMAEFIPNSTSSAIVILGMVGYFTGVVQTPITAFVIVMEMTDNSGMLMPLMATALIARSVSRVVCPIPIYEAMAQLYIKKVKEIEKT
ncbi:MAG: chloride channel protein [Thiohalomonadales bacterium]